MPCKMCLDRGKTWKGSDPKCYFDHPRDNWMCATVIAIRHLCPPYSDPKQGIHSEYCNDDWYAVIKTDNIDTDEQTGGSLLGRCLYIAWYKDRGHTEALWILGGESENPRVPTEEELLSILEYYRRPECPQIQ